MTELALPRPDPAKLLGLPPWARLVVLGFGLVALCLLIWFGGALVAVGAVRPLEAWWARAGLIAVIVLLAAGVLIWRLVARRRAAEVLARGLLGEADDGAVLADKMKEALAMLRQTAKSRSTYLYDLPWYLLIGPPASGKTTALVNSGLKFPLARGLTPEAVEGIGGTRYCDWLFTEEAVLIDTAGRYTTQDSDPKGDHKSWLAFLDLLKRSRPRQPINGVIIAFPLPDLLTLDAATLNSHANAIRARLLELHGRLKVDFPVYALFTKADLVAGFLDYFGDLSQDARHQVWGATFQTKDRKANLVGDVPAEFDALIERLNLGMADRLQDEPVPSTRVALFGFPGQMSGLKKPIFDFLKAIFEPTRYQANATLRGFYFTSGAQNGMPIDRLLMALTRNFGAREMGAVAYSGRGKSFFLTDLIGKVIVGEAAWVSTDFAAIRRAMLLKVTALTLIAAVAVGGLLAWWTSYGRNDSLIAATDMATGAYQKSYGALATQSLVADYRFESILPPLDALRAMPPDQPAAPWSGFGLGRHADLAASAEETYGVALERLLRPRLLFRLEAFLDQNSGNPLAIYEALKVYMMLGGQHRPIDRKLVLGWIGNDLNTLLPGGGTQEEARGRLLGHVAAMLDDDGVQPPLVEPSGLIQSDAQKLLTRLTVAQRAYASLKAQARTATEPDWDAAQHGGQDFARVFDIAPSAQGATIRVPGFYTYAGFYRSLLAKLPGIAAQIKSDDTWVLGDLARQSTVAPSYETLDRDVLALYRQDFDQAWQGALARLQLKRLTGDRPTYAVLDALSAKTTTPLIPLLTAIRDETALTRPRPGFQSAPPAGAAPADGQPAPELAPQAHAPGADIEADFAALDALIAPAGTGGRPVDDLIDVLHGILVNLPGSGAPSPAQTDTLFKQVSSLKSMADRLPPPFKDMMQKAAAAFDGDVSSAVRIQLARSLNEQVIGPCRALLDGAYPFVTGGKDLRIDDFARLFAPAPTGAFDAFFIQYLQDTVDMKRAAWSMRPDAIPARSVSVATLSAFQRASAIRDVFFPPKAAAPSITFRVVPSPITLAGYTAKLEINGTIIESKINTPTSGGSVTWPGSAQDGGVAAINLISDTAGETPVGIDPKYGGWALFRLLDGARPIAGGLSRSFVLGPTELEYKFLNPKATDLFRLIRSFSCPAGL